MKLERVLYVEDEPDIRTIAKLALEVVGGMTVELCDGGQTATDKALSFAPDLIMLDVMMPGMDGPATLRQLRAEARTAHIPVIFLTAKIQPADVDHYQALGAVGVIAKPFDPMKLASEVRKLWDAAHE